MNIRRLASIFAAASWMRLSQLGFAQCSAVAWHAFKPNTYASNIALPKLVFDENRGVMVAVGYGPNGSTALWEYQSGTWSLRHNTLFQLCAAPVVPFGPWVVTAGAGTAGNCYGGGFQIWLYNGTNWSLDSTPGTSLPDIRSDHAMCVDPGRGVIVLFGGRRTQTAAVFGDTWEYNGAWRRVTPTVSPAPRSSAAMLYDSARQVVVMTAGSGASGYLRETWEYNGVTWTQRGGTQPPALADPLFAFDPRRNCGVLYTGQGPGGYNLDTWEYRDGAWTLAVNVILGGWGDSGMAYDPEELGIMLFDPEHTNGPVMRYYGCAEPVIHLQPQSRDLCSGELLYLSCGARGIGNFTFQWRRNGVNIAGANSSLLLRQPVSAAGSGSYTCAVTSPYGPVSISDPAVVRVDSAGPLLIGQPQSQSVCEDTDVTFSVTTLGARYYQWRKGGVEIYRATSSSLTILDVTSGDAGSYDCVVSNFCGSNDTQNATLAVYQRPRVTNLSPATITIRSGQSAVFRASTTGASPIAVRWLRNGFTVSEGPGGASPGGGAVVGSAFNMMTLANAQPSDSGDYCLRADNFCGLVGGEVIRLVVANSCPADLNDGSGLGTPDGGVTIEDLLYFIGVFAEGNIAADLDDGSGTGTPDGGVTIDDLLYFLQRFEGGC